MKHPTLENRLGARDIPKPGLLRRLSYRVTAGLATGALLASMALAACNEPTPTATSTPSEEPAITATYTPSASPTYTPTSAPTLAPITLGAFSAKLEGIGTNGTMACYTYGGDAADLEKLTLTANISQGTKLVEKAIPSQQIDGKTCFEVVDAKYVSVNPDDGTLVIPEDKVSLELNATSTDGRAVTNSKQAVDLGKYVQFPFLGWIYQTDKVCKNNAHENMAWDFVPYPTSENPTIVNTPLLSPTNGIAYVVSVPSEKNSGISANSVMVYSPTTGFLIDLTHDADTFFDSDGRYKFLFSLNGQKVNMENIIARIGAKDDYSGIPHTHMQILIPPDAIDVSADLSKISSDFYDYVTEHIVPNVDFIQSHLFLDESINNYLISLPNSANACGNLPWGTLSMPPPLPLTIDGNASDWASYSPVLTDPAGDSQAGNVMDFTELYTAKDDNYLYFMVKMGQKPDVQYWFNFLLDTNSENQCGAADKILSFSLLDPTGFAFGNLVDCEEDSSNSKQYSGASFAAGDVLEGKIHLLYLGNPYKLDIVKIIGNIFADGRASSPDTMP